MTKFKKGTFAAFAVVVAAAGISAAVIPHQNAKTSYAVEIETVGTDYLDVTDTTLNGLADGVTLNPNTKLVIPEGITDVAPNAFRDCWQILSVTVPSTLMNIGEDAFKGCTGLVEVINKSQNGDFEYLTEPTQTSEEFGGLIYYALSVCNNEADSKLVLDGDGYLFCTDTENSDANTKIEYLVGYAGTQTELSLPADCNGNAYGIYEYAFRNGEYTSVSAESSRINYIGQSAFYGCAYLAEVTLPDSVEIISASAFEGCAALNGIALPTGLIEIGNRAFYGCVSLGGTLTVPAVTEMIGDEAFSGENMNGTKITGIVFEEHDVNAMPLDIGYRAFAGSSELSVLKLPEGIGNLAVEAFVNCSKLNTAYVSAGIGFAYDIEDNDNKFFNDDTVIILEDYDAYSAFCNNLYMITHTENMTFPVELIFDGGSDNGEDGGEFYLERLANKPFNFVKGEDDGWSLESEDNPNALLPVQNGYTYTQWYKYEDFSQGTGAEDINYELERAKNGYYGPLTFYARYLAKPEITVRPQTFDENAYYTAYDFIDGNLNGEDEEIFVASIVEAGDDGTVHGAGPYTLEISLSDAYGGYDYGIWETNLQITVKVERKFIEFTGDVLWQSSGNDLSSGNVYVYTKGDDVKYSYSVLKDSDGYKLSTVLPITNSIVRYKDRAVTLTVNDTDKYYTAKYTGMEFNGAAEPDGINEAAAVGRYEAKALLEAVSNYRFLHGGETVAVSTTQGVTITISNDGESVLVTKIWYILDLGNELVFEGTDDSYGVEGWRYKEGAAVPAPAVAHTDDNTYAETKFTLVKDGVAIGGEHLYERFADYVNASMPAGSYALTFEIPDVLGDSGDIEYSTFKETFNFTVLPARFLEEWKEDLSSQLQSISTRYTGGVILYDNNRNLNLWADDVIASFNPERTGVWAKGGAYDHYYSDRYVLKYNLARMQSNDYFTREQFTGESETDKTIIFKPVNPDTYTVYYQFEANNYEPLVNSNDDARRNYKYELIIFDVVTPPEVETLTYTGVRTLPYIKESALYTIVYDESEDSYIDATRDHKVTLELVDGVHYKWLVGNSVSDSGTLELAVRIDRAENSESLDLSMPQWLYGSFDHKVHFPVWGTYYNDPADLDFYSYKLIDKDGKEYGKTAVDKDGKKYLDFSEVGVGTYTLVATAKGYKEGVPSTAVYNWEEYSERMTVIIDKGIIGWSVTPNVMQWSYGGYNAEVNLVLGETNKGNTVKFKVTSDKQGENVIAGLEEFTSKNGVVVKEVGDELAKLTVGAYFLWASVDESASYEGLNPEPLEFAVTIAQNYWEEAPSIVTWLEGNYDGEVNIITSVSHFGSDRTPEIVITVAGDGENVVYDNVNGINLLAQAKTGAYELRATLAGTDDYTDLTYSFTFQIFEKEGLAWWIVLLIVVGTVGVLSLILFILHQKGVLQLLTGRFVLAMRARATVDATIAAVRANKVAEEAKKSVEMARQLELEEEKRRRQEEIDALPEAERAAILALSEQASAAAEKAEELTRRANEMQQQADDMLQRANGQPEVGAKEVKTSDESSDEE